MKSPISFHSVAQNLSKPYYITTPWYAIDNGADSSTTGDARTETSRTFAFPTLVIFVFWDCLKNLEAVSSLYQGLSGTDGTCIDSSYQLFLPERNKYSVPVGVQLNLNPIGSSTLTTLRRNKLTLETRFRHGELLNLDILWASELASYLSS